MNSVYSNEKALTKVLFYMEKRGILVDQEYVMGALQHEQAEIEKEKEHFKALTGRAYKDSPKLFKEIFTEMGSAFPTTAKGNPSFTSEVLAKIKVNPAPQIEKIREHEKRAGTYYSSFLYHMDTNSVLHANIRQAGTKTGRFSYSDPNLQNVPKEDDQADLTKKWVVRGSFIPREDFVLCSIDYDQVEYKLMLDYAGEQSIIERVLGGEDLHQATADMVGISRKNAKTLNFSILYGSGIVSIAQALGISRSEAECLRSKYFSRLPKVKRFISQVTRTGEARGYIFNWMNRKYHLKDANFSYALPNHLIQGGAAEVVKVAMVRIHELLKNTRSSMILQVHDDIISEIHKDEMDLIPKIRNIMQGVYTPKNGLFLTASPQVSTKSWAYRDFEDFKC